MGEYYCIYAIVLVLSLLVVKKTGIGETVFKPKTVMITQLVEGIIIGGVMILVVGIMNVTMYGTFYPFQFRNLEIGLLMNFFCFQMLVAITEEVLFRGVVCELGEKLCMNWVMVCFLSALLFALVHWIFNSSVLQFLFSLVMGIIFAGLYIKMRKCTIYSLIIAHFLYDIAIINII